MSAFFNQLDKVAQTVKFQVNNLEKQKDKRDSLIKQQREKETERQYNLLLHLAMLSVIADNVIQLMLSN
jgi:hypothetical protein